MNESEFHEQAAATMERIEEAVEASGADIDFEIVSDILTLTFEDDSKIIVNKQSAADQLWVAARSGGYHYDWDASRAVWLNDRSGEELFSELARLVSEQAGATVSLA